MYKPRAAKAIERTDLIRAARRVLFTHSEGPDSNRFDLQYFYQFGTGVVLLRRGELYLLTASHVVRNATSNVYANDSPFWVTREHQQPENVADFLMPMRFVDLDPEGHNGRDVALAELAVSIRPVPNYLDWDDASVFVHAPNQAAGATGVVIGYPAQLNEYTYTGEAGRPFANIVRATFRGHVKVEGDDVWFQNETHRAGFDYAGLSGGLVICFIAGQPKCLGIAVSYGDQGRRFRVVPFSQIRAWLEPFEDQPWQVVDEAYFLRRMTHQQMTYADLHAALQGGGDPDLRRTNEHLKQLIRSMREPRPTHWVGDLRQCESEVRACLLSDLARSLSYVAGKKMMGPRLTSRAAVANRSRCAAD